MQAAHREHSIASFQRPLAVSLGIHVLICGTALVFAHYGETLFTGGPRVITVALVADSGRSAAGPIRTARRAPITEPAVHALPDKGAQQDAPTAAVPGEDIESGQESSGAADSSGSSSGGDAGIGSGEPDGPEGAMSSEQWRLLQSALEKVKTYPRLARERGIEGTVLVRFKVLPSGTVETVNVVRSSGASILDEASVKTVYRAAPMPYVQGWVEVPMSYVLK